VVLLLVCSASGCQKLQNLHVPRRSVKKGSRIHQRKLFGNSSNQELIYAHSICLRQALHFRFHRARQAKTNTSNSIEEDREGRIGEFSIASTTTFRSLTEDRCEICQQC
jgi:hypothetical protein